MPVPSSMALVGKGYVVHCLHVPACCPGMKVWLSYSLGHFSNCFSCFRSIICVRASGRISMGRCLEDFGGVEQINWGAMESAMIIHATRTVFCTVYADPEDGSHNHYFTLPYLPYWYVINFRSIKNRSCAVPVLRFTYNFVYNANMALAFKSWQFQSRHTLLRQDVVGFQSLCHIREI